MAATIPSSIVRHSMGSNTLYVVTFPATADDTNTWASGLSTSITGYWANGTDDPTQTKEGIDVALSSGTFTFSLGEDDRSFVLYVLTTN
jgi:hypothetical protein